MDPNGSETEHADGTALAGTVVKPTIDDALRWIGSRVDDVDGAGVGRLIDVWVDPLSGNPRWLLIKEGRFGGRHTLLPFEHVASKDGRVSIPYQRELVRAAPEVKPGIPLGTELEQELRRHYAKAAAAAGMLVQGGVPAPTAYGDPAARDAGPGDRSAAAQLRPDSAPEPGSGPEDEPATSVEPEPVASDSDWDVDPDVAAELLGGPEEESPSAGEPGVAAEASPENAGSPGEQLPAAAFQDHGIPPPPPPVNAPPSPPLRGHAGAPVGAGPDPEAGAAPGFAEPFGRNPAEAISSARGAAPLGETHSGPATSAGGVAARLTPPWERPSVEVPAPAPSAGEPEEDSDLVDLEIVGRVRIRGELKALRQLERS